MSGSYAGEPFGSHGRGPGSGWPGGGSLWEGLDQLKTMFEKNVGVSTRMGRGDVRAAVLALLAEQPMHGYQIIHEIEERSGGSWKPSAGSVYPTLQLLADEGLISAEESGRQQDLLAHRRGARRGRRLAPASRRRGSPPDAADPAPARCRRPASSSLRRPRRWAARELRSR